jgi:hypothetical protein
LFVGVTGLAASARRSLGRRRPDAPMPTA